MPRKTLSVHYGVNTETVFHKLELPTNPMCRHTQFCPNNTEITAIGTDDHSIIGAIAGYEEDIKAEIDKIKIYSGQGLFAPFYVIESCGAMAPVEEELNQSTEALAT